MRWTAFLLILTLPLFAGCFDEAAVDATDPTGAPETPATSPQAFTWTGDIAFDTRTCTSGTCALVVDMEHDPTYPLGTPSSVEAELRWDNGALELGFTLMRHQGTGWSDVTMVVGPSPLHLEVPDLSDENVSEYQLAIWHPCKDYIAACIQAGPPTTFTVEGTFTTA